MILISAARAARMLRLDRHIVGEAMRRGEIPTVTIRGRRYVNAELLRRWLGMPDLTFLDDTPPPAPRRRPSRVRF